MIYEIRARCLTYNKTSQISIVKDLITVQSLDKENIQIHIPEITKSTLYFKNRVRLYTQHSKADIIILDQQEMQKFLTILKNNNILILHSPFQSY